MRSWESNEGYFQRNLSGIFCIVLMLLLSACANPQSLREKSLSCSHETGAGGIFLGDTIGEFTTAGFTCGDSVDVTFSNMYELKNFWFYRKITKNSRI